MFTNGEVITSMGTSRFFAVFCCSYGLEAIDEKVLQFECLHQVWIPYPAMVQHSQIALLREQILDPRDTLLKCFV